MRDKVNILNAFNSGRKKSKEAEKKYGKEIIEVMVEEKLLNDLNSTGTTIITSECKLFLKEFSDPLNILNYKLKYYSPFTTFIMGLITGVIIPVVIFMLNQPK